MREAAALLDPLLRALPAAPTRLSVGALDSAIAILVPPHPPQRSAAQRSARASGGAAAVRRGVRLGPHPLIAARAPTVIYDNNQTVIYDNNQTVPTRGGARQVGLSRAALFRRREAKGRRAGGAESALAAAERALGARAPAMRDALAALRRWSAAGRARPLLAAGLEQMSALLNPVRPRAPRAARTDCVESGCRWRKSTLTAARVNADGGESQR
jgi:hypothetical protein